MKWATCFYTGLILLALCCPIVYGQEESHHHNHHGSDQIGEVHFPVSCNAKAQEQFTRGVALLHSFDYEEAEKAFAEVLQADPQCVMGYWGIAMSLYHPLWVPPDAAQLKKGQEALQKASALEAKTQREKDYLAAINVFYANAETQDHKTRVVAYEKQMKQLFLRYPEDQEAAAFFALALNSTAQTLGTDKTFSRQKKAVEILEQVRAKNVNHPGVYHYIIHNCDYPELAEIALPAARMYAKIAPTVPHALHMPSHIFTRLGLWDESIGSNLDSKKASEEYAEKNKLPGAFWEQLHAMDYLMYAHLQKGEDEKAKAVLDELKTIERAVPQNFAAAYAYAAIPARYALERKQWAEAEQLKLEPADFPWSNFGYAEANIRFARGVGAARNKNLPVVQEEIRRLSGLEQQLAPVRDNYAWSDLVRIQLLAVQGLEAHIEGKSEEALTLLLQAAELEDRTEKHPVTPGSLIPARELYAEVLMDLRRPQEALQAYEASLKISPKRWNALYGAARAAKMAENDKKAKEYYSAIVALGQASSRRKVLQEAETFLASN